MYLKRERYTTKLKGLILWWHSCLDEVGKALASGKLTAVWVHGKQPSCLECLPSGRPFFYPHPKETKEKKCDIKFNCVTVFFQWSVSCSMREIHWFFFLPRNIIFYIQHSCFCFIYGTHAIHHSTVTRVSFRIPLFPMLHHLNMMAVFSLSPPFFLASQALQQNYLRRKVFCQSCISNPPKQQE